MSSLPRRVPQSPEAKALGDALSQVGATIADAKQEPPALQIFAAIPPRYGIIAVEYDSVMFRAGEVAVYDEMWTSGMGQNDCPLEEGGIYVTEYQRPPAMMTWEAWIERRDGYCPSRLQIDRSMVRVSRWPRDPKLWGIHPLAKVAHGMIMMSDGPLEEFPLVNKIIGKVVGIYNPSAIKTGERT